MIGTKLEKPLEPDSILNENGVVVPNDAPNTLSKYAECAKWCNENGTATIEDKGDYYEAVPIPEPTEQELASSVRSQRDAKLSTTDYLVIPDYPISPEDLEAVKAYRQALRDISEQSGFPKNVQWPVEPQFLSAKQKNEGSIGLAKVGL
jgi:hypothetical protein